MVVVDDANLEVFYLLGSSPRHHVDDTDGEQYENDRKDDVAHHLLEFLF